MIYRKVYVSRSVSSVTMADVRQILETSRSNNHAAGLSGLLVFHGGRFFQVLEGAHDPLMACYERILKDLRHDSILLMAKGTAPERAFGQWKMGFAEPSELSASSHSSLVELTKIADHGSKERGDNDRVKRLLDSFLLGFRGNGLQTGT